jgi:hypothetical protein
MNALISKLERNLPRKKIDIFGEGSLMKTSVPYYFLALLTATGFMMETPNPFAFIAIVYSALPILDEVFSLDERNPSEPERRKLEHDDAYFRMALYAAMVLDWAAFIKMMYQMQNFIITPASVFQLFGVTFIVSNLGSIQFAVAH